jgi:drug/metabolite transporter (DMT)-like permease
MIFILIFFGVLLNSGAQLLLKVGVNQIGYFEFNLSQLSLFVFKVVCNIPIVAGLMLYVMSVVIWLLVLSRVPVSYAYPLLSLGYLINAIAAFYLLHEPVSALRILGILIIMAGVYLVSQSN